MRRDFQERGDRIHYIKAQNGILSIHRFKKLKYNYSVQGNNAYIRHHILTKEKHSIRNVVLLIAVDQDVTKDPTHYRLLPILMVAVHHLMVQPRCQRHQIIESHEETELVLKLQSAGMCCLYSWKGKGVINPTQL